MMTLRQRRVWHWQWCLQLREQAKQLREHPEYHNAARLTDLLADFHIGCVQVLNDVVFAESRCETTAEQDLATGAHL